MYSRIKRGNLYVQSSIPQTTAIPPDEWLTHFYTAFSDHLLRSLRPTIDGGEATDHGPHTTSWSLSASASVTRSIFQ